MFRNVENLFHKKSCFSMLLERFVSGLFTLEKFVLRLFGYLGVCCLFHAGVVGFVLSTTYIAYSVIFIIFGGKSTRQH
jgi:hypothetical protein